MSEFGIEPLIFSLWIFFIVVVIDVFMQSADEFIREENHHSTSHRPFFVKLSAPSSKYMRSVWPFRNIISDMLSAAQLVLAEIQYGR